MAKRRSSQEIKSALEKERKKIYSQRSRAIAYRKKMKLSTHTDRQLERADKKIENLTKRIDNKSVKLFKYTDKYQKLKKEKSIATSSRNYFFKMANDPTLDAEERKKYRAKMRKMNEKIGDLKELMGLKLLVKRGKPEILEDVTETVSFWVVPFWEAGAIFEILYSPEKYKTIDLEGDITSLDSQLAYIFAYEQYINLVEKERFDTLQSYHISIEADRNTAKISATRV